MFGARLEDASKRVASDKYGSRWARRKAFTGIHRPTDHKEEHSPEDVQSGYSNSSMDLPGYQSQSIMEV